MSDRWVKKCNHETVEYHIGRIHNIAIKRHLSNGFINKIHGVSKVLIATDQ
jgi:hypothetical protein